MFIYSAARAAQLMNSEKVILAYDRNAKKIMKNEYPYSLNEFSITKGLLENEYAFEDIIEKWSAEKTFDSIYRKLSYRIARKPSLVETITMPLLQPIFNSFGSNCAGNIYHKQYKHYTKNLICEGYFQSEKYFKNFSDIIKNELRLKQSIPSNKDLIDLEHKENSVCVHVRRGDYTGIKNLLICTPKYYEEAIRMVSQSIDNPLFIVFTDDVAWTRENICWPKNTIFADNLRSEDNELNWKNPFQDLEAMPECKHFIISNSSFSWWAQYLSASQNKIVVAPSIWQNKHKKHDIYMKDWNLLESR